MKNLMKAPMRITTDSWPSRKPSVNDNLQDNHEYKDRIGEKEEHGRRRLLWC